MMNNFSLDIKTIANNWFEAFNKHDLDMLLSLYDKDAEHFSPKLKIRQPETKGLIKGKAALHNWWEDSFQRLPSLNYEVTKLIADEKCIFMGYIRHVIGEDDLIVGEVLEIENNLIVKSRVYHS